MPCFNPILKKAGVAGFFITDIKVTTLVAHEKRLVDFFFYFAYLMQLTRKIIFQVCIRNVHGYKTALNQK